jgi:hypothetical protein
MVHSRISFLAGLLNCPHTITCTCMRNRRVWKAGTRVALATGARGYRCQFLESPISSLRLAFYAIETTVEKVVEVQKPTGPRNVVLCVRERLPRIFGCWVNFNLGKEVLQADEDQCDSRVFLKRLLRMLNVDAHTPRHERVWVTLCRVKPDRFDVVLV